MRTTAPLACIAVVALTAAIGGQPAGRAVDDRVLRSAGRSGGDWLTYGLSQAETRFSPLTQISPANITRLGLAWTYEVGRGGGGQEATPLVWNDTLFGITNWSVV
ncbi:MAG TPA: PQQ-dependent dehydrogenase, methanol/ethanol family, partial [Chloroflexota bacterium]|nr:PQQ-dependent dehydrogenase, methanol/ethanol family [Chloroflexota bacterium]